MPRSRPASSATSGARRGSRASAEATTARRDGGYEQAPDGLTGRFDAIVAAGDDANGKPAPDPYFRAAERLGMAPANCLALEDLFNGVRAAAAAGMHTVMVPDLLSPTDEIRALCKFVALDLHEVCDRLA